MLELFGSERGARPHIHIVSYLDGSYKSKF